MIIFVYFYPLSALFSSDLETVINEWWNYFKVNSTVEFPKHQKFPKLKSSEQDLVWLQKIRTLLQPLIRTEIMVKKYYFSSEELLCFKYFFIEMLFPIIKCCMVVWYVMMESTVRKISDSLVFGWLIWNSMIYLFEGEA